MSSYKELLAQREQLDKQIKEAIAREKADGITKAKLIIEQYNLSASDLFSRKAGGKSAGGKVAPKYRNPSSGETWTGRGKAPKWIEGRDRSSYLISVTEFQVKKAADAAFLLMPAQAHFLERASRKSGSRRSWRLAWGRLLSTSELVAG